MEIFSVEVPNLGTYKIGGFISAEHANQYTITDIKVHNDTINIYCDE